MKERIAYILKLVSLTVLMFSGFVVSAQNVPTTPKDTTKTGSSVGQLSLPNPKSILEGYTYDPVSDRYIYTQSVDGFSINYPLILTPAEYEKISTKRIH